ncbi:MAG: baseplate J/gp47 family protein [Patescibacteria group bacterium]|nr:baseplate J/gp47 family protein [Patescibacteria group bacterium]
MKLSLPSIFGKKEKPEHYLALLLRDEKISAVVFEVIAAKIKVIGKNEEYFKDSIENITEEELIDTMDKAISIAESSLPENTETLKTVFGVKQNWVEQSKIKHEYLVKLKKASDDLGLSPIGFLVIQEAITHHLQQEEGAPVSAILIEVDKKNITVSLVRAGKIIETKTTKIEDPIPKTTDRILHHFTDYEVLPSRIIIYNDKENEELAQEFIGHTWSKSLPFLHVPQIVNLPRGFDSQAILFGAATQMGFEVLGEDAQKEKLVTDGSRTRIEEKIIETDKKPEKINIEEESFGFVKELDVLKTEIKPEEIPEEIGEKIKKEEIEKSEERFENPRGFKQTQEKDEKQKPQKETIEETNAPEEIQINYRMKEKRNIFKNIFALPIRIIRIIPFKKMFSSSFLKSGNKIIFIPPVIITLLILLFVFYIFYLGAEVTLNINPKSVEKNQDISFVIDKKTDFSKNIIAGKPISVSESGDTSTPATGKKETGDKAKGSITLYSRFTEEKTLPAGTTIVSPNDLHFTLDKDVTISSGSGDASSLPVTKKADVTAKEIGKEYNLPSGTKFTISSYPTATIVAKNDSAFSGGTKKEITIVSKDDVDKLTDEVTKKFEKKAKDDIIKKINSDSSIIPVFSDITLSKKQFSKKPGDETSSVSLKATIDYTVLSYLNEDLKSFSANLLKNDIQDMVINNLDPSIKNPKIKNEKEVTGTIAIKASLLSKIDEKKMTEKIKGKSFKEAKEVLSKLPQVSGSSIFLSPNIPFLPEILPQKARNIKIIINSND